MRDTEDGVTTGAVVKVAAVGLVGLIGLTTLFGGYFTVGERERSVVTRNGKFQYVAGPGLHFKVPFIDGAYDINVDRQSVVINDAETYTTDSQKLFVDMVILYQVPDNKVEFVYRELRDPGARLSSLALDRMKRVLGRHNAWGVPTKRTEVAEEILAILKRDSTDILQGLEVLDVQLPDISYTKEFQEAVNRATIAQTEAGRAEADQKRVTIEQQTLQNTARSAAVIAETQARAAAVQRTLAAEAEARATELRGRAEAENIRLRGIAEADALKAQNDALTQQGAALVQLRQAEKWDGKLPGQIITMGGAGSGSPTLPILHMQGPNLAGQPDNPAAARR